MGRAALARAHTFDWDEAMACIAGYYEEIFRPEPALNGAGDGHAPADVGVSTPVLTSRSSV